MTSDQATRAHTRLAAVIVIAAVVIGSAIFTSSYNLGKTTTLTQTATATSTVIITTVQATTTETSQSGQASTFATSSSASIPTIRSTNESLVSSSATLSGITTIATSSLASVSGIMTQNVVFGIMPQYNATTEIIPANTLAWTSWTIANSTQMWGFEGYFPIGPQNYNSSIVAMVYVNGVLDGKTVYGPIGPPPQASPPGSGLRSNSTVTAFDGYCGFYRSLDNLTWHGHFACDTQSDSDRYVREQ